MSTSEVWAKLTEEQVSSFVAGVRAQARREGATRGPSPTQESTAFDPFRPVAARGSDVDDAIGLVRRGVRLVPFAETTPLLPLYRKKNQEVPPELAVAHEEQGYEFFLVQLTFSLRLEDDESPDRAEFVVEIHDGVEGPRATRTVEVFPKRADVRWFEASGELAVNLESSLKFSVEAANQAGKAKAEGGVEVKGKVLAGPFHIEVGQTQLTVAGESDREIAWIYQVHRALAGKSDFQSFLVLKIARETLEREEGKVSLQAKIGVRTYRRTWKTLWLKDTLPVLHAKADLELDLPKMKKAGA